MFSNPVDSFFVVNTLVDESSLISSPSAAMALHSSSHASAQYPSLPGAMRRHSYWHLDTQNPVSTAFAALGSTVIALRAIIAVITVDVPSRRTSRASSRGSQARVIVVTLAALSARDIGRDARAATREHGKARGVRAMAIAR